MQWEDTPLHKAAQRGFLEVVTKLIESGADVNARDVVSKVFLSNYILGCTAPKYLSVFECVVVGLTCAIFVKVTVHLRECLPLKKLFVHLEKSKYVNLYIFGKLMK